MGIRNTPRAGLVAALLILLALAAACGARDQVTPSTGTPATTPVPGDPGGAPSQSAGGVQPDPPVGATGAGQPPRTGGQPTPVAAGPTTPPPAPADPAQATAVPPPAEPSAPPLDGPLGSLCRTYLQPAVPELVIEIDAQDGAELSDAVLTHLRDTLAAVVDKPGGVRLEAGGRIDGGAQPWTLESVRSTAAATRDVTATPETAVLHVLALRGEPDQSDPPAGTPDIRGSIGVAFAAGEFVVFPDRVESLAALLGGVDAVLRAVAVHEAGHLLCLVNIGYESDTDHEDPEHPGHSRDRGSVMFHAIETTAIGQLFAGPPPATFAPADLADLDGLRTGRL